MILILTGGFLVNKTHDLSSAFYIAGLSHVFYLLFVIFLLPESLSPEKCKAARIEHEELKEARKAVTKGREGERDEEATINSEQDRSLSRNRSPRSNMSHFRRAFRKFMAHDIFTPLHPMAMLLPRKVQVEETNQLVAHGLSRYAQGASSRSASVRGRRIESTQPEEEPLLSNVEGEGEEAEGAAKDLETGRPSTPKGRVPSSSHISVSYVPDLHPVPPSPHPLFTDEPQPQIPTKARPRDWNLFFLSSAYGVEAGCYGVLSAKTLYSQHKYGWGPREIGLFLSLAALSRVIALVFILPLGVKIFHKNKSVKVVDYLNAAKDESLSSANFNDHSDSHIRLPGSGDGDGDSVSSNRRQLQSAANKELHDLWAERAKHVKMLHDSSFDLKLARFSLFWMMVCYSAMAFGSGPVVFCVATALSSLGGGGGAACSSLALNILRKETDAGKLLGAWSIVSGISGSVVGPILFSMLFVKTVDTFSESIFVLAVCESCF